MTSLVRPRMLQRYLAECLGTFAYVFFGCGTVVTVGYGQDFGRRLIISFTFGFTILVMTYALSHISAAPFNPAITLGLAIARRFSWRYVLPYWFAQFGGALLACSLLFFLFTDKAVANHYGATIPGIGLVQTLVIEAVLTFFLMLVAMSTAIDQRVNRASVGLAMGLMLTLGGFFAGPLTGGSMNPARSLAPALFTGGRALAFAWMYLVGPLAGAVLGALVYEVMRGGREFARSVPEGIFEGLERRVKGS